MKKIILSLILLMSMSVLMAQVPNQFTYQAVVRNTSGYLVTNSNVDVSISILQGSENGTAVFSEQRNVLTNANGLFTINIGEEASLDNIDWANGPYFLKSEVALPDDSGVVLTTVQQILSVPYAMHAHTADMVTGEVQYTETDPVFTAWDKDYNDLINTPEIPTLPENVSAFTNDAGYITNTSVPTNVSQLNNDAGYMTSYTETQNLANVVANGNSANAQLKNVVDPTDAQDAVTKAYLEAKLDNIQHLLDSLLTLHVPAPTGAINGRFTINANGDKVYFSMGNLQYIGSASTPYWKFADKQWEYLGDNGQGSDSQTVDRDLFGWGTSGYDHGATCYQPWSTSLLISDYASTNLYDNTGMADWGYNAISNGGNHENQWRTLTRDEWKYVLNFRTTTSGIRYAKATVNGVGGLIILPDNWNDSYYTLNNTNDQAADLSVNTITESAWNQSLESHGAVFLPAAGYRKRNSFYEIGSWGVYWTATIFDSGRAYRTVFYGGGQFTDGNSYTYYGQSVRLVCPVE